MGMASQISEKEDTVLCSDVRDKLFGPMEFSRRDLGALNIMRGRDNGLPDYNTARYVNKLYRNFKICTQLGINNAYIYFNAHNNKYINCIFT